jgi:DNA-binding LacI/PurR family transcriptional regulator
MAPVKSNTSNGTRPPFKRTGRTKPATLADVATLAGVVPMTASRAINHSGYVSDAVRTRVLAAAQKLRYRPNMLARQLRGSRLNAIGILLPDIANPFSAELLRGINQVFDAAGYTTFIATAGRSVEQERSALQAFVDHRIDGLLVATRGTKVGDDALKSIATQGVPIVTIGRPLEIASVDCITANHWQGAYDAVTHLIQLKHSRIAFIGSSAQEGINLRRYEGYRAALHAAGLPIYPEYSVGSVIAPGFATEQDGYAGMLSLAQLKKPPTAIFARNDFAAIGALHAAHILHLKVPQDMAIAGFDNIPIAAYQTPPLTTVEQPIEEQGRIAAELLLKRIEGSSKRPRQKIQMNCKLIIRESTSSKT